MLANNAVLDAQNFAIKQLMVLLISALFLLFIYPRTGLDQALIAPYFDVATQSFPLKHHVFLDTFMHAGLKYCIILIAVLSLLMALRASIYAPYRTSFFARFKIFVKNAYFLAFIDMVLSTSVVSFLKSISMHGCPNDLTVYGGNLPLFALFEVLPKGVAAGHCFPGGHASGGFALMAFYVVFRLQKPAFANAMLVLALMLGFCMGWSQMMRGEHFLSHTLWTAWVVWLVLIPIHILSNAQMPIKKDKHNWLSAF